MECRQSVPRAVSGPLWANPGSIGRKSLETWYGRKPPPAFLAQPNAFQVMAEPVSRVRVTAVEDRTVRQEHWNLVTLRFEALHGCRVIVDQMSSMMKPYVARMGGDGVQVNRRHREARLDEFYHRGANPRQRDPFGRDIRLVGIDDLEFR